MHKPKKRGWGKFVNFNLQDETSPELWGGGEGGGRFVNFYLQDENFTKAVKEIKQIRDFKLLLKIESF